MEYLVTALWVSLEMLSLYFFTSAFTKPRFSKRLTLYIYLIAVLLLTLHSTEILFSLPVYLKKGISFGLCLVFTLVTFSSPWYLCVMLTAVFYFAIGAFDTIVLYAASALYGISVSDLVWKKILYTMVCTLGKCITLFICWGLCRLRDHRERKKLSLKRIILTTLFPLISILLLFPIFQSYKLQGDLSLSAVVFSIILLFANGSVLYLMDNLDRTAAAEHEVALLNQSMALQSENYQALEKSYRAQRSASHEFQHQLQVIQALLKDGNKTEVQAYIDQLQGQNTTRIFATNSKHPIIDAVLNEKYQRAKENNIDIQIKVNDLSRLQVHTDALVVLLSNLMDNAIEACLRVPSDRSIECSLVLEDSFLLSIRNTSLPVQIEDGLIETTKASKSEHGFGLSAVRRIIEQLNGEYVIDYTEPWFQFVADIPNQ